MNRILCVIFSASVLLFIASEGLAETSGDGEAAYNKHCAGCHGAGGTGTDKGPPLVHRIYRPGHHADMSFHLAVQRGVRRHHWRFGEMPPVKGVEKEEVDMIIKYVRGLQREAGIF